MHWLDFFLLLPQNRPEPVYFLAFLKVTPPTLVSLTNEKTVLVRQPFFFFFGLSIEHIN